MIMKIRKAKIRASSTLSTSGPELIAEDIVAKTKGVARGRKKQALGGSTASGFCAVVDGERYDTRKGTELHEVESLNGDGAIMYRTQTGGTFVRVLESDEEYVCVVGERDAELVQEAMEFWFHNSESFCQFLSFMAGYTDLSRLSRSK
jgi:hypothetical protein